MVVGAVDQNKTQYIEKDSPDGVTAAWLCFILDKLFEFRLILIE